MRGSRLGKDTDLILKSIRVHLSPGSSCGLVTYTCATVYFLYGIYSYLLTVRDSGFNDISQDSEACKESIGLSGFMNELWPISEGSGEVK